MYPASLKIITIFVDKDLQESAVQAFLGANKHVMPGTTTTKRRKYLPGKGTCGKTRGFQAVKIRSRFEAKCHGPFWGEHLQRDMNWNFCSSYGKFPTIPYIILYIYTW